MCLDLPIRNTWVKIKKTLWKQEKWQLYFLISKETKPLYSESAYLKGGNVLAIDNRDKAPLLTEYFEPVFLIKGTI